jgi:hypothetical protein
MMWFNVVTKRCPPEFEHPLIFMTAYDNRTYAYEWIDIRHR